MSAQGRKALEILQSAHSQGGFEEQARSIVAAHLSGSCRLSLSRLRRFLLTSSVTVSEAAIVLEPLLVEGTEHHNVLDMALAKMGPSWTLSVLKRRAAPVRLRGIIGRLNRGSFVPRPSDLSWLVLELPQKISALGQSDSLLQIGETFELLAAAERTVGGILREASVGTEFRSSLLRALLSTERCGDLASVLVSKDPSRTGMLGLVVAGDSVPQIRAIWSEFEAVQTKLTDYSPNIRMLVALVLDLPRTESQNQELEQCLSFLLTQFSECPVAQAYRSDCCYRALFKLTSQEVAEQFIAWRDNGVERNYQGLPELLMRALLRDTSEDVKALACRHANHLAEPFVEAVKTGCLERAVVCLNLCAPAKLFQPMLFFLVWEHAGFDEKEMASLVELFLSIKTKRLHARGQGEELNPVAFLRSVRSLEPSTEQMAFVISCLGALREQPGYDPQKALSVLAKLEPEQRRPDSKSFLEKH